MVDRLVQRARGRVLRSDLGIPERPKKVDPATWDAFTSQLHMDDSGLFLDYAIKG